MGPLVAVAVAELVPWNAVNATVAVPDAIVGIV
jgi:hypothetical protein